MSNSHKPYIGAKVDLTVHHPYGAPTIEQGRIVEETNDYYVVQYDHRILVDGSKDHPIYKFYRNSEGHTTLVHKDRIKLK